LGEMKIHGAGTEAFKKLQRYLDGQSGPEPAETPSIVIISNGKESSFSPSALEGEEEEEKLVETLTEEARKRKRASAKKTGEGGEKVTKRSTKKGGQKAPPTPVQEPQGRRIKMIAPKIQAVVNKILYELPPLPKGVICRINRKRYETIFTLAVNQAGFASFPLSTHIPGSWNMSLAVEDRPGEAVGVVYLLGSNTRWEIPYMTLIRKKEEKPPLRLYGFASTKGETRKVYILQVNSQKEVLITEWGLTLQDPLLAKRWISASIRDRLPLESVERTQLALPELLKPLGEVLHRLYQVASGKKTLDEVLKEVREEREERKKRVSN